MKFIYIPKFKFGKIIMIFDKNSIFSKMSVTVFCQKWAAIYVKELEEWRYEKI